MLRIVSRGIPLAVVAVASFAGPVAAQSPSTLKKAATSNNQSAAINVPANERITTAVLDKFERGLAAYQATLDSAKAAAPPAKTAQAYQQCAGQVIGGPEMRQVMKAYTDAMAADKGNNQRIQQDATRYGENMQQLLTARCGNDPSKTPSSARAFANRADQNGRIASGLQGSDWSLVKERIPPFCNLPASKRGSGDVRAEGQYVYLASEAQAIAPRCASLMPKLSKTN